MFVPNESRDLLGPTPSVSEVMEIMEDARRCNSRVEYEDGWISGVHSPLLRLALNGKRGPASDLLDVLITYVSHLPAYITAPLIILSLELTPKLLAGIVLSPARNRGW